MKRKLRAGVAALLMALALVSCGGGGENKVYEIADMAGKTVGVVTGTASPGYIARFASPVEIKYYDDADELKAALKNGSVDCALADTATAKKLTRWSFGLTTLDDMFVDCDYRIAVSVENTQLIDNLNAALRTLESRGTLEEIVEGWQSGERESEYTPDAERDKITVAIDPTFYPYAYYNADGELAGLEIDVVRAVCSELELEPDFVPSQQGMILYMAESGKTAFAIGRIVRDPDNEAVSFSTAYMHSTQVVVVRG